MSAPRRSVAVWAILVILLAEFLLITGVSVFLLFEVLTAPATSIASAVALTILSFIAAAFVGAILVGAWRGRAWIRGAGIVWQVLQFAIGLGAVQGAFAQPALGWPLIAVSVLGFLLLVSRPVVEQTQDREQR